MQDTTPTTPTAPRKEHPYHFLDDQDRLSDAQLEMLEANASERTDYDELDLAIFRFHGREFNFVDKEVWVNSQKRSWVIPKSEACTCDEHRSPLLCHCSMLACPGCGQELSAWNVSCEFDLTCLDNGCPHCQHYRSQCGRQEILDTIQEAYGQAKGQGLGDDEAALEGIAAIHGDVDPARFEVTDQFLDRLGTRQGPDRQPEWKLPDGATVSSTRDQLWYQLGGSGQ